MTIDINHLRNLLLNYAGIGWTVTGSPIGIGYLSYIESASPEQLIQLAMKWGIIESCF